jgi:phosphopantetheinyl transferase
LTAKELLKFNKIQSIPDRIIFLTKMWTLKEAIIKLKGSGVMRKIQLDNSSYYTHTNFNKSYVLSFAVKKHSEYQIYNI